MLGIDEGAGAAALLRLGDRVQRERGLAGAFRAVDLDDAAAWQPADAECQVEAERAGRDYLDMLIDATGAHAHDGALAESPLDLSHGGVQGLVLFHQRFLILAVAARLQADDVAPGSVNILHTGIMAPFVPAFKNIV